MCFAHTYNVKQSVTAGAAVDPEFKLTSCVLPRVNADDTTHMSKITGSINSYSWQVAATSKHPEEAVKFVDYLMSPEVMLLTAWGTNEGDEKLIRRVPTEPGNLPNLLRKTRTDLTMTR